MSSSAEALPRRAPGRTVVAPWVLVPGRPPIRDGAVSLDSRGNPVVVGRAIDRAGGGAEELRGVLLPGFTNAHTHLELSHLRVAGGDGLVPWIRRLLETRTPPEEGAIRAAVATLEARGTVAVADVSNSGATVQPLASSGLEHRVFAEVVAPRPSEPLPALPAGATGHSTYATHAQALRAAGAASIHVEEDPAEAELLLEGTGPLASLVGTRAPVGLRPVEYLDSLGLLGKGTLLVHMTCAGEDTLALAARRQAVVVLCPRSNRHIGGRLPPWRAARAAGCRVALGTDSLASCPSLDVLGDVALLARDGADPAWLLECATTAGREALGFAGPTAWIELGDDARAVNDPVAWVAHEGEGAPVRRVGP